MNPIYLFLFAAVAANSFLSFGFGVRQLIAGASTEPAASMPEATVPAAWRPLPVVAPAVSIFVSGSLAWPLFAYALAPLSLGFLENLLLLPVAVSISLSVEKAVAALKAASPGDSAARPEGRSFASTAYDGLAYAAAYLSLRYAEGMPDAVFLSAGAAIGFIACSAALNAIRERSDTEPVPRCLRGIPLLLIASGLLSILAAFLSAVAFNALGGRM